MEHTARKEPMTFTDFLRKNFKYLLDPVAALLNRIGLMPNTVTILGLVGNAVGAYLLATGHITAGGIVILIMGPIDALDGTMARLRGEPTDFGAFVDSVTDRYSELVIFLGLMIYFIQQQNQLGLHPGFPGGCRISDGIIHPREGPGGGNGHESGGLHPGGEVHCTGALPDYQSTDDRPVGHRYSGELHRAAANLSRAAAGDRKTRSSLSNLYQAGVNA